jgi:hypothetical protein
MKMFKVTKKFQISVQYKNHYVRNFYSFVRANSIEEATNVQCSKMGIR